MSEVPLYIHVDLSLSLCCCIAYSVCISLARSLAGFQCLALALSITLWRRVVNVRVYRVGWRVEGLGTCEVSSLSLCLPLSRSLVEERPLLQDQVCVSCYLALALSSFLPPSLPISLSLSLPSSLPPARSRFLPPSFSPSLPPSLPPFFLPSINRQLRTERFTKRDGRSRFWIRRGPCIWVSC